MIFQLDPVDIRFPSPDLAEEDGLLAIGGDLMPERLLNAYKQGIFPWYSEDSPILWYAPPQRFVLNPANVKVSKSMQKILSTQTFQFTFDRNFEAVIHNCASINRMDQDGTWIVQEMKSAYKKLHHLGYAHSIEVWQNETLVGGLYGVLVGNVFCGESMFSSVSNASKAALIYLCQSFDLRLIDCQIYSDHLASMGARLVDASRFYAKLEHQYFTQYGLQQLLR